MGLEQAVVKCKLPGDVTLELRRPVRHGSAGGEKQMMVLAEINDRAEVECRVAAITDLQRRLMVNFGPNQDIGQNLFLQIGRAHV